MLLAGCAEPNKLLTFGGVCQALPQAEYQIKGKTRYDQIWIDKTIESEVTGCQWDRPKPRPAKWDVAVVVPPTVTTPPVVTVSKPSWIQKLKHQPLK
jgi:hypothetical protein